MINSLEKIWISERPNIDTTDPAVFITDAERAEDRDHREEREASTASSLSLGDTHIWRDDGDSNV